MSDKPSFPYHWVRDTAGESLIDVINNSYSKIKEILSESGAILFEGFEIDSDQKLEECVSHYPGKPADYVDGNSPRTKVHNKVYTSTEYPPEAFISLHNEMSYAHAWPRELFFCCVIPAQEGGSTVILDSRAFLLSLSEATKVAFKEKGVKYIRNLHGGFGAGVSWQETFETESKEEIEAHCKSHDIIFEWNEDDDLKLIQYRPAVIEHPDTGAEVWFNQADQFHFTTNSPEVYEALMEIYEGDFHSMPHHACFGDDSEIPLEMLEEIRTVARDNMVSFPWKKGDMMLVDNVLTAHGRTPYKGDRKILVSMTT